MEALSWLVLGVLLGAVVTAVYYRRRIRRATKTLSENNQSLRDAVHRSQPKE